jgi:hypothetical protein
VVRDLISQRSELLLGLGLLRDLLKEGNGGPGELAMASGGRGNRGITERLVRRLAQIK